VDTPLIIIQTPNSADIIIDDFPVAVGRKTFRPWYESFGEKLIQVSREQCRICLEDGQFFLYDLKGQGTIVNGVQLLGRSVKLDEVNTVTFGVGFSITLCTHGVEEPEAIFMEVTALGDPLVETVVPVSSSGIIAPSVSAPLTKAAAPSRAAGAVVEKGLPPGKTKQQVTSAPLNTEKALPPPERNTVTSSSSGPEVGEKRLV